jgi:ABC-type molybdate transport system substrate-binding protein
MGRLSARWSASLAILLMASAILRPTGPSIAQVTFDIATTPGASLFIGRLLSDFREIDPALVTVLSSGIDDKDLVTALTTGLVDLAFTTEPSWLLRSELDGMIIDRIATPTERLADARPPRRLMIPTDIYAIHPASPSPDVTRFLRYIASRPAAPMLRDYRVDTPGDSTNLNAALRTPPSSH